MNNKGFTLLELLTVISIVAIVGVASAISFSSIKDSSAQEDLKNKYKDIQRGANLFLDLNTNSRQSFLEQKQIDIKLATLRDRNYINKDLTNPVTGDEIDSNYYVRLCIVNIDNVDIVDSYIIEKIDENANCVVNSKGEPCDSFCGNE